MRTPRWAGLAVVIAAAGTTGAFVACSDFTPPGTASSSALVVKPKTAHLNVGGTMQLTATGSSGAVVWSSTDQTVATVSFGKVTAVASGSATIRAVSGTNEATTRITVTRAAAIALSSTNVTFNGLPAAAIPDSQTVDVTNSGEDPLTGLQLGDITYGTGATGWLTAQLTESNAPAKLVLRPNTSSLAPGSYTATVSISAASVTAPPQLVTVTFTLIHPAVITFGTRTASFTGQQGAPIPNQQSIEITNSGDAPLTGLSVGHITYSSGAANWLDASVNPTVAPALLVLRPNTSALAAGTYSAKVSVASTAPGVTPDSVTVTYNVTAAPLPPTIDVSPASLSFVAGRAFSSLPVARQIDVTAGGTGTIAGLSVASITYGAGASNWLSTSFVGGVTTAPTTLDVQPNTTALTAGAYSATIHLSSTTSGVVIRDIPVTYVVNDLVLDQTSVQFSTTSPTAPAAQVVNVSNAGSGSISGVTASVTLLSGRADATYAWLQASIAGTVPQSPSATSLTLAPARADSLGDFMARVTVSAPNMVSKTVTVSYRRQATMALDVFPILHDSVTPSFTCRACHSSATTGNFSIDFSTAAAAYSSLLTPASTPGHTYIVSGDSAASNLYKILNGAPPAGYFPMPSSSCTTNQAACMNTQLRTRIYIWIVQGALQNP